MMPEGQIDTAHVAVAAPEVGNVPAASDADDRARPSSNPEGLPLLALQGVPVAVVSVEWAEDDLLHARTRLRQQDGDPDDGVRPDSNSDGLPNGEMPVAVASIEWAENDTEESDYASQGSGYDTDTRLSRCATEAYQAECCGPMCSSKERPQTFEAHKADGCKCKMCSECREKVGRGSCCERCPVPVWREFDAYRCRVAGIRPGNYWDRCDFDHDYPTHGEAGCTFRVCGRHREYLGGAAYETVARPCCIDCPVPSPETDRPELNYPDDEQVLE